MCRVKDTSGCGTLWLDAWVRNNKKRSSILVVSLVIALFFWYWLLPCPTPSIIEFINTEVDITLNETRPEMRVPAHFSPHCHEVHIYGTQVGVDNDVLTSS